jgi:hypothetical protein
MEFKVIRPALLFCLFLTAFTQVELLNSQNDQPVTLIQSSTHLALSNRLEWGSIEIVKTEAGYNIVRWVTLKENSVKEFLVQRSDDGHIFHAFRRVDARGDKYEPFKYQVTDHKAIGKFFYRIIAIDNDGNATYSKVIAD